MFIVMNVKRCPKHGAGCHRHPNANVNKRATSIPNIAKPRTLLFYEGSGKVFCSCGLFILPPIPSPSGGGGAVVDEKGVKEVPHLDPGPLYLEVCGIRIHTYTLAETLRLPDDKCRKRLCGLPPKKPHKT